MFGKFTGLAKGVALVLATSTFALAASAGFTSAEARYRRGNAGAAAAVGIIGGLAAGALIAGAARPAYAAPRVYDLGPAYPAYRPVRGDYYAPAYEEYYEPVCRWERRTVWLGRDTYQIRRVKVCE